MLALVLAVAMQVQGPTFDEKGGIGVEMCDEIAYETGYDDCMSQMSNDGERMWLHYHCATFDAKRNLWLIDEQVIVPYRWTGRSVEKLRDVPMEGCP